MGISFYGNFIDILDFSFSPPSLHKGIVMVDNILVTVEEVLCPEDGHEDVPAGGVLRYPRDPLGGGAQPEGDLSAGVARGHGDVTQMSDQLTLSVAP